MALTVEVCFNGHAHSKEFAQVADVSMSEVSASVRGAFGLDSYVAKYLDEDGDACTLTVHTLADAVEVGLLAGGVLKLQVHAEASVVCADARSASVHTGAETTESTAALDGSERPQHSVVKQDDTNDDDDRLSEVSAGSDEWLVITSDDLVPASASCPSTVLTREDDVPSTAEDGGTEHMVHSSRPSAGSSDSAALEFEAGNHSGSSGSSTETSQQLAAVPAEHEDSQPTAAATVDSQCAMPSSILEAHMMAADAAKSQDWTVWDKISIVIAAFDIDGDGRLSREEFDAFQQAAAGSEGGPMEVDMFCGLAVDVDMFCALCTELGADAGNGLGPEDLSELYARYDTLDRDFKASQEKLQNFVRQVPVKGQAVKSRPLWPVFALVPFIGVPGAMMTVAAVGVARHMRQK